MSEDVASWELAMDKVVMMAKKPTSMAPYKIFKVSDKKFVVKNNAGEVKATFDSRDKALNYLRALYKNVPGAAKSADKKDFSGKQKRRA